jgi:hypothetical protein
MQDRDKGAKQQIRIPARKTHSEFKQVTTLRMAGNKSRMNRPFTFLHPDDGAVQILLLQLHARPLALNPGQERSRLLTRPFPLRPISRVRFDAEEISVEAMETHITTAAFNTPYRSATIASSNRESWLSDQKGRGRPLVDGLFFCYIGRRDEYIAARMQIRRISRRSSVGSPLRCAATLDSRKPVP